MHGVSTAAAAGTWHGATAGVGKYVADKNPNMQLYRNVCVLISGSNHNMQTTG